MKRHANYDGSRCRVFKDVDFGLVGADAGHRTHGTQGNGVNAPIAMNLVDRAILDLI